MTDRPKVFDSKQQLTIHCGSSARSATAFTKFIEHKKQLFSKTGTLQRSLSSKEAV